MKQLRLEAARTHPAKLQAERAECGALGLAVTSTSLGLGTEFSADAAEQGGRAGARVRRLSCGCPLEHTPHAAQRLARGPEGTARDVRTACLRSRPNPRARSRAQAVNTRSLVKNPSRCVRRADLVSRKRRTSDLELELIP
jgi:hypothetical protein